MARYRAGLPQVDDGVSLADSGIETMVVSGCVGPRGDGYQPSALMTADEVLDDGDPHELGRQYELLRASLPAIGVLGRCCGTDLRHVEQIAVACVRSG
jgi:S-methylmethionine-dependent homocysteine/selenocysteine methylase